MKKEIVFFVTMFSTALVLWGCAAKGSSLDSYMKNFTAEEKFAMRINAQDAAKLISEGNVVLVDVRFAEETKDYNIDFALKIPVNELPDRIGELPKDKLILTACLSGERANMARLYLASKGFNAKYLHEPISKLYEALNNK